MDDSLDMLLGLDKRNEIFSIWYEVIFLRLCINHLIDQNALKITQEVIDDSLKKAQDEVRNKFPKILIDFKKPEVKAPDQNPTPTTHEEHFDVSHLPSNEG